MSYFAVQFHRWVRVAVLALWGAIVATAHAAETRQLTIGLVPNVSARALIEAFEPMRAHLERELSMPVQIYTAPDFRTFFERTQNKEFGLVVTPAHFAWLAISDAGHVPLLTYKNSLRGLLVVAKDSPVRSPAELKGKTVGLVDPLAIVTMRGLHWLNERGLEAGRDFKTVRSAPHNTAALAVANGHLDAAIVGSGPYYIMADETRAGLRVLAEAGEVPNAVYLASGELPARMRAAIRAALVKFGDTAAGARFMAEYRYDGFSPITSRQLRAMDVYSRQVRALMVAPAASANPGK